MTHPPHHHATERFTGLAQLYAQCRPGYPAAAIDFLVERCQLRPGALAVDVGCGTGISTRLLARRGVRMIGIEPNADMRRQAEAETLPPDWPAPEYRAGQAEATGLPTGLADVVLAAQAFHWFDADRALREFYRLLKPAGWAALLNYERDETDPFTAAYGAVLRATPGAAALEDQRGRAGDALLTHPLFTDAERRVFADRQTLDAEGLRGRVGTVSYAPKEPAAVQKFMAELLAVFARFQENGQVTLHYETRVFCARRRAGEQPL